MTLMGIDERIHTVLHIHGASVMVIFPVNKGEFRFLSLTWVVVVLMVFFNGGGKE